MPYKFDTIKLHIPRNLDKRIKISLEDRKEIKRLYYKISQRKLAKMFNCSRRSVIFIGCPEKLLRNLEAREERGGTNFYYNREKQREYMKKYRNNKQKLYLKNKLIDTKE